MEITHGRIPEWTLLDGHVLLIKSHLLAILPWGDDSYIPIQTLLASSSYCSAFFVVHVDPTLAYYSFVPIQTNIYESFTSGQLFNMLMSLLCVFFILFNFPAVAFSAGGRTRGRGREGLPPPQ